MATLAGELVYKITGDSSGITSALKKSDEAASNTASVFSGLGKKIIAGLSVAAAYSFGKAILSAASDATETGQKFGVVFAGIGKSANDAAKELSASFGMSSTASKELLSNTGNILQSFGYTKKASLESSVAVNKLAADLVSFSNYSGGVSGASDAITKALLGEREALKGLRVAISDADLKDFAAQSGLVYDKLDKQKQAQLTLELITKRSANATGDFSRSMGSFANQSRIAESNIANIETSLGNALIPFANIAVTTFNEMAGSITDTADSLAAFVTSAEGAEIIGEVFGNIAGAFAALKVLLDPVIDIFVKGAGKLVGAWKNVGGTLGDASGKMTTLAAAVQFCLIPLELMVLVVGNLAKDMVNLLAVAIETGKGLYQFGLLVARKISWDQFNENTKGLADTLNTFGKGLADSGKDLINFFTTLASGDATTKAIEKSLKAFEKTSEEVGKKIKQTLEASKPAEITADVTLDTTQARAQLTGLAAILADLQQKAADAWKQATPGEQFLKGVAAASDALSSLGNIISAVAALESALNAQKLAGIEAERQATLEAYGVAEDTAVETAQKEYDAAVAAGNASLIKEKQDALTRAKINEDYDKKKAKAEYESALVAWELQRQLAVVQGAIAVLNAISAGAKFGPWGMAAYGALATIAAGIQIAAVEASRPTAPKFANGGIVPGSSFTGDNVLARVNSGEMVLNQQQQANLLAQANGGGGGFTQLPSMSKQDLFDLIFKASQDGDLYIANRAVVNA